MKLSDQLITHTHTCITSDNGFSTLRTKILIVVHFATDCFRSTTGE